MNPFKDQVRNNTVDHPFSGFHKVDIFRADDRVNRFVAAKSHIYTFPDCPKHFYNFILYHGSGQNITVTDEISYKSILWFVVNVFRCADLLDISLVHDNNGIGHGQRFLLIMGDIDKGDAKLIFQADQLVLHVLAQL